MLLLVVNCHRRSLQCTHTISIVLSKKVESSVFFLLHSSLIFLLRGFSRRLLCYNIMMMFSLWKYQVQKEKERETSGYVCVYNDGSQSVKRRRTLSTRCLVQFTNAGRAVVDLPHHPFFYGGRI